MPQKAPTFYHWSQDKPCTTNQTYGFQLRNEVSQSAPAKIRSLNDYTRPFSNSGFFPQLVPKKTPECERPQTAMEPGVKNKFDINRGYSMGHVPVYSRIAKTKYPIGVNLDIATSVPSTFSHSKPKANDLFLWHTLAGTLVHCKNHVPKKGPDPYCVPKISQSAY